MAHITIVFFPPTLLPGTNNHILKVLKEEYGSIDKLMVLLFTKKIMVLLEVRRHCSQIQSYVVVGRVNGTVVDEGCLEKEIPFGRREAHVCTNAKVTETKNSSHEVVIWK